MRFNAIPITATIESEKFSAIKSSWKLETFLDSGLKRRVCLPDKNPEREKESKREGDGM